MSRILACILCTLLAACEIGVDADAERAAPGEPAVRARGCTQCGWIESKRELPPEAADPRAPRSYEYMVRMTDGSSSVFRQQLPASWRLGERLSVIAGAGAQEN
jgi:hypothetical protein